MILFGVKLSRGQPNLFSLLPRRLGMSSLTQKPGIKDRIRSLRTWIKKIRNTRRNSRYRWDVLADMNLGLGQLRVTRVSMIGRCLSILLVCISLTACSYPNAYSTSRDVKFSKRGTTQQQLDADWSACRRENTVAMSFAEAYTEPKRTISYAEEYLINGCMAGKGYTVTW